MIEKCRKVWIETISMKSYAVYRCKKAGNVDRLQWSLIRISDQARVEAVKQQHFHY